MVGCYVFKDAEYLTLVQTIPISTSTDEIEITPDNLPHSLPLLLYSAPVISNSYFSNNEFGRESFMLSKKLYNGVTGHKNIESEPLISNETTPALNNPPITQIKKKQKLKMTSITILKVSKKNMPN
ncbi:39340_t:CDS:2 [Gigaspora margarita]|uniref:39340_t:CDS:1 n=1 Tax=Gigaspora margarita TaxID=4874 RepID=A0ABN7UIB9_GIGMA|nr:39340_t:CDS:2 [Gigaspora margarita]